MSHILALTSHAFEDVLINIIFRYLIKSRQNTESRVEVLQFTIWHPNKIHQDQNQIHAKLVSSSFLANSVVTVRPTTPSIYPQAMISHPALHFPTHKYRSFIPLGRGAGLESRSSPIILYIRSRWWTTIIQSRKLQLIAPAVRRRQGNGSRGVDGMVE